MNAENWHAYGRHAFKETPERVDSDGVKNDDKAAIELSTLLGESLDPAPDQPRVWTPEGVAGWRTGIARVIGTRHIRRQPNYGVKWAWRSVEAAPMPHPP